MSASEVFDRYPRQTSIAPAVVLLLVPTGPLVASMAWPSVDPEVSFPFASGVWIAWFRTPGCCPSGSGASDPLEGDPVSEPCASGVPNASPGCVSSVPCGMYAVPFPASAGRPSTSPHAAIGAFSETTKTSDKTTASARPAFVVPFICSAFLTCHYVMLACSCNRTLILCSRQKGAHFGLPPPLDRGRRIPLPKYGRVAVWIASS